MSDIYNNVYTYTCYHNYVVESMSDVSEKSLGDDCDCSIKTYFKSNSIDFNPESNIESPLTELGLIKLLDIR